MGRSHIACLPSPLYTCVYCSSSSLIDPNLRLAPFQAPGMRRSYHTYQGLRSVTMAFLALKFPTFIISLVCSGQDRRAHGTLNSSPPRWISRIRCLKLTDSGVGIPNPCPLPFSETLDRRQTLVTKKVVALSTRALIHDHRILHSQVQEYSSPTIQA